MYTTKEAFLLLKGYGLATNLTVFRKWITQGKISVIKPDNPTNRKEGYRISEEELLNYVGRHAPRTLGLIEHNAFLLKENEALKQELKKQKLT